MLGRDVLGRFAFRLSSPSAGLTMQDADYSPNDTAMGGFTTEMLAIEDFANDDWYLGSVATSISFEDFEEFSKDYSDPAAWGIADAYEVAYENFSTGFAEGIRPETDKPSNCGTAGEAGSEIYNEDLTSQVNGANRSFSTAKNFTKGTLRAYRNGQRMADNEITETGSSTFSTTDLLSNGEVLYIDYRISSS